MMLTNMLSHRRFWLVLIILGLSLVVWLIFTTPASNNPTGSDKVDGIANLDTELFDLDSDTVLKDVQGWFLSEAGEKVDFNVFDVSEKADEDGLKLGAIELNRNSDALSTSALNGDFTEGVLTLSGNDPQSPVQISLGGVRISASSLIFTEQGLALSEMVEIASDRISLQAEKLQITQSAEESPTRYQLLISDNVYIHVSPDASTQNSQTIEGRSDTIQMNFVQEREEEAELILNGNVNLRQGTKKIRANRVLYDHETQSIRVDAGSVNTQ